MSINGTSEFNKNKNLFKGFFGIPHFVICCPSFPLCRWMLGLGQRTVEILALAVRRSNNLA
jgi:hypothetical protein